jgi:tryptophan synthase alpha chain
VSRLEEALKGGGKLIAYAVAGDPTFDESYEIACGIIGAGADVLELGLPFSDPIADGPTIQEGGQRALAAGMNTDRYFELAAKVRERHATPLVCMTYYSIILQCGLARFSKRCAHSGIDGVIVPDLPLEEARPLMDELKARSVDFIFLVAETTPDERLRRILGRARGFVYVVAQLGTTGARSQLSPRLRALVGRVKRFAKIPVAVGFGISTPEHVRQVLDYGADAAIVGSGIVKMVPKERDRIPAYIQGLAKAASPRSSK